MGQTSGKSLIYIRQWVSGWVIQSVISSSFIIIWIFNVWFNLNLFTVTLVSRAVEISSNKSFSFIINNGDVSHRVLVYVYSMFKKIQKEMISILAICTLNVLMAMLKLKYVKKSQY